MNKEMIEKKYHFTKSDTESMLKKLRKFINSRRSREPVEWALNFVDFLDSYELAIRFLIDITLTNKQPRYKHLALDKILQLLRSEDLTKEYLKELINPLKEDLIENDDEWVSLKALQIYEKLTTDEELIISKAFELIERRNINDKVKAEAFRLVKDKEISLNDIEKNFLDSNDSSAKFWYAFLLYSKGKLRFREHLEKVGNKNKLNEEQIRFWNSQAIQYSFPEIYDSQQEEDNQSLQPNDITKIFADIFNKERVFLAFAEEDETIVKELYIRLEEINLNPWMYTKDGIVGENWKENLPEIIKKSKFAIICLSKHSVRKRGFIQREIKYILEEQEMRPQKTIYTIPLRINNCVVPDTLVGNTKLTDLSWTDYFEKNGFRKIVVSMMHELSKNERKR